MSGQRPDHDESGWTGVLLMKSWSSGEAAIIGQLLATYGIHSRTVSDVPHSLLPVLGEIRILVSPSRLEEAAELIAAHRRQGFRVIRGGRSDRRAGSGPGASRART